MRRLAYPPLIALLVALLAGCGTKHETIGPSGSDRVRLMLDYTPNADHVGLYKAMADGDFKRAGLDVQVLTPGQPSDPLRLLQAGKVDLAVSYEPEVLLARDKGAPLVSVGAIAQRPLTSIMSVGSKAVRTPAELAGTTVGTAGIPYQSAYLKTILARAHVAASSVHETSVGFNLVPAMLSHKVDATLGAFWNIEGVQLQQSGRKPSIIRVDEAGVPTYDELVVAGRRDYIGSHGSEVRRFMQALGRGYAAARSDPSAGVSALLDAVPDLRSTEKLQEASVRASLPVFFPGGGKPFGWQDPQKWEQYGRWMHDHRLVGTDPLASEALTNEFLAGQGG